MKLYDTNGTTLLAPASGTTTAINWTALAGGTYYLLASDNMGAARDYTIAVNLALPDLTESFATQSSTTVVAGDFINVTDTVTNVGFTAAGAFTVGAYLSADNIITSADTLIASRNVAGPLFGRTEGIRLAVDHSDAREADSFTVWFRQLRMPST